MREQQVRGLEVAVDHRWLALVQEDESATDALTPHYHLLKARTQQPPAARSRLDLRSTNTALSRENTAPGTTSTALSANDSIFR